MSEQPRTGAGRALLDRPFRLGQEHLRELILAIEATAAVPLDVERLARALHYLDHGPRWEGNQEREYRGKARVVATAYARLSADEEGGTT